MSECELVYNEDYGTWIVAQVLGCVASESVWTLVVLSGSDLYIAVRIQRHKARVTWDDIY